MSGRSKKVTYDGKFPVEGSEGKHQDIAQSEEGRRDVVVPKPALAVGQEVAWIAPAWITPEGRQATPEEASVALLAVSVNAAFPTTIPLRLELLRRVASRALAAHPKLRKLPSLWTFPGGYFGFDAWRWGCWDLDDDPPAGTWLNLSTDDLQVIKGGLGQALTIYPGGATVALGVDRTMAYPDQYAWILKSDGVALIPPIRRRMTDLPGRQFLVGGVRCAAFVCGEGTGSRSEANGPYYQSRHLDDPVSQMPDTRVLTDLSHAYVRGTGNSPTNSNYLPHQRAFERFSVQGAAVMAHHHDGAGRCWDGKDWIIYRGDGATYDWVPATDVLTVIW